VDDDTRREQGTRVRREVLGDAHVDAAAARTTPVTAAFQDFLTRTAWGDVWSRPGLDRRTRSMLTVALLAALGRDQELDMHLRGARRNGVTDDELVEVLLQTAVYAGIPAANHAVGRLAALLDEG
jgi:4-carboxymuconolactone decarboxylase